MLSGVEVRRILAALGMVPNRRLGQIFLIDRGVALSIVGAAAENLRRWAVFELGSGLGNLTEVLSENADWVFSVELEERFVENTLLRLKDRRNISIIAADAISRSRIRSDLIERFLCGMEERGIEDAVFVSNMPYCISGAVLMSLPLLPRCFLRTVIMTQDEVFRRTVAEEGSREYGVLSLVLRRYFEVQRIRRVPSDSFYPVPKVESVVVRLKPRGYVVDEGYERDVALLTKLFSTRRKTIRQTLKIRFGLEDGLVRRIIKREEENMRVEQLPPQRLWRLVEELKGLC